MSSFLFDFAIGLGGSDLGGSIEQPIMDREVILISSSSSEATRRGASGSESSSSKKVRTSRRTGRGTSCPYERARPFVAVSKPVPVIVILQPSTSRGVRRVGGGGDVRLSPRV